MTQYSEACGCFELDDEKDALINLFTDEVQRMLEDENSEVSCILNSTDEE